MKTRLKRIAALIILVVLYFFIPFCCDCGGPSVALPVINPSKQEKALEKIVGDQEKNIARFQQREAALNKMLLQSKDELSKARRKNRQLLDKLTSLTQHSQPDSSAVKELTEGGCSLEELDSGIAAADSLCDEVITGQEQLLVQKDSVISLQQKDFISLKAISHQLVQKQSELARQSNYYRQQYRKMKRKNSLLSLFSAALSVMVVQQLMQ